MDAIGALFAQNDGGKALGELQLLPIDGAGVLPIFRAHAVAGRKMKSARPE